jgi:hypothetical protein
MSKSLAVSFEQETGKPKPGKNPVSGAIGILK